MDDVTHFLRHCLAIILPPALIGMSGSVVKYFHDHGLEPFSWWKFVSGMIVSGFVGVVISCLCKGLEISPWTTSALVAMSGYSAGQILDLGQKLLFKWLERNIR